MAGRWAEEHPREAIAYVALETGSSEAAVELAYGEDVNHHLKTDLEPSGIAALSDFKDFLVAWGFLPANFDVQGWIDPRPLEAARKTLGPKTKSEGDARRALKSPRMPWLLLLVGAGAVALVMPYSRRFTTQRGARPHRRRSGKERGRTVLRRPENR